MPEPPLKRLEELFHRALALPPDGRAAFLDETCAGEPELRAALENLLAHDATGPIPGPVVPEPGDTGRLAPTRPALAGGPRPAGPYPRVPGYELLRVLGRGGMGVVYLARHLALNRLVALKMLSDVRATSEQVARFRGEAEALARLRHPNVVPIYDVGEFEGHPYFTMEHVAGPSLAALLDGRPQDVTASARLVETLARAAHAVHRCGIVHRDLKPANVLMSLSGDPPGSAAEALPGGSPLNEAVAKITDFGIARDQAAARRLTRAGEIMGTPGYMAPEQVRDAPGGVGPGADVYALGAILYEMLTGRTPFDAATPIESIARLLNEEPVSPALLRPRLPADLATVCLKCLEKSPRRRYASALDLAEDLRRFRAGEPVHARPVGPAGRAYRWCLRRPLVAGLVAVSTALALVLIATVVGYQALLSRARAKQVEQQRQEIVRLDVRIAVMEEADGDAFTAVLWLAEALRLEEQAGASGREQRSRIAVALGRCPHLVRLWSRDDRVLCATPTASGAWVATAGAGGALRVWDAVTGQAEGEELRPDGGALRAALSADGRLLATVGAGGAVRVWDVRAGTSRPLPIAAEKAVSRVAFPDGGRVLLTEQGGDIRLWDLTRDPPAPLPSPWSGAAVVAALGDDARWLFTRDHGGSGQVWDMATGLAVGPRVPPGHPVTVAAVSADGRRVAVLGADGTLRVWDGAAGWVGGPMRPRGVVSRLAFCPDGERVITAGPDPGAQVWRAQAGEVLDLPTRKGATGASIHFSPDGRLLAAREGPWARVWDLDAGRPVTPPLRHGTPVVAAAFCADGRQLVTVSTTGTVRVWELPAAAGDEAGWNDRPQAEIIAWAHVLACARINPDQQPEDLDDGALRLEWESLGPR